MKRAIARKWVKALKSGDYAQVTGSLRGANGFCCLGVLCSLHAEAHPELAKENDSIYEYMGYDINLPPAVVEWAGMYDADGTFAYVKGVTTEGGQYNLMGLNDDLEYNFKQIGDVISRRWKDL